MRPQPAAGLTATLVATAATWGCSDSATAPGARPCATRDGIEICADRSEYRPGATVTLTLTNGGAAPVFVDDCSVDIVGKTSREVPFDEDYDPTLRCGQDVTPAEIVSRLIELPPGTAVTASYSLATFAFQGFYRVNVWIVDATGARTSTTPHYSGTFEVFPTASG